MAAHSSILAWRIPWTEEPGSILWDSKESDMTKLLTLHFLRLQASLLTVEFETL